MRLPHLNLTSRITLAFFIFATVLVLVFGVGIYRTGLDLRHEAVTAELLGAQVEKQAATEKWIGNNQLNLAVLASSLQLHNDLSALDSATRERVSAEMQSWVAGGEFPEVLLLEEGTGKVLAGTDPGEVGKFKEDQPFFIQGRQGPFVQPPFYSLKLQGPAKIISQPIRSPSGVLLAVLAARVDLLDLSAIISRRTGVHQTDDAFLIDRSNLFITQPRIISDSAVLQRGNYTPVVNRCIRGESGTTSDIDYRGVPVLAVYKWLPANQLCLIVQIDQAEAYAPIQMLGVSLLVVGCLALLVASALAAGLARTITEPILAIQRDAARFGRGERNVRFPEHSRDELGILAHEFNAMASTLAEKESRLLGDAAELEDANRRQVSEIAERKRTEEAILRRNAELAALNQIGQALSRLAGPEELLELIYTVIGQVLDNRNLFIALYDEATQRISFPIYTIDGQRTTVPTRAFATGLTEDVIRSRAPLLRSRNAATTSETRPGVLPGVGGTAPSPLALSGNAPERGRERPLLGNGTGATPKDFVRGDTAAMQERDLDAQDRPGSCFWGVPMLVGDKVIGVIAIQDGERDGVYDRERQELLTTIALQAAVGLENSRLFTETERLARTDELTGLANRRYLFEVGARELSRARRFGHPLSALVLDIDHFKDVNDMHGHPAGDRVLQALARCCLAEVRDTDLVARYGGEEIVILFVETDLAGARTSAERLRERVAQTVFATDQGPLSVTISVGLAGAQLESDGFTTLFARADSALYAAKQAGRNRVAVSPDNSLLPIGSSTTKRLA
jgi:diguanylate cyclase (GGDEF)-like protein